MSLAAIPALTDVSGLTIAGGHFPTYKGIKYVFSSNKANLPVTISFTGPWDFTTGPKELTITSEIVDKTTAYNYTLFPSATVALKERLGPATVYMFYRKASNGLIWYGASSQMVTSSNFTISPSIRRIFFPAKQGIVVAQNTTFTINGVETPVTLTLQYVGKGTVTVGAGTFNDAVMLKWTYKQEGDDPASFIAYDWIAPYVGIVAQIRSLDGETNELFTTAAVFRWLRTCSVP
jgi:hypothetical protein